MVKRVTGARTVVFTERMYTCFGPVSALLLGTAMVLTTCQLLEEFIQAACRCLFWDACV